MKYTFFILFCCNWISSHPFFPEEGVDALLFAGPTFSALSFDTNVVCYSLQDTSTFTPSLSPGFTVGTRLLLDHDNWDGSLIYYWNKNTTQVAQQGPVALEYNIANHFPFPAYTAFDCTASLDASFKTLFLEIGRFVSNDIKKCGGLYRVHFGFAGTWEGEQIALQAIESSRVYTMSMTQDVWGAGFRTGFDTWYYFTPNYAFHATAATSLLWTRYRVRRKDFQETTQVISVESNYWKNSPGIDMSLGFHGEKEYASLLIAIDCSWFMQVWTNHLRFFLLNEDQQQGDIGIQGVSATFTCSF